MWICRPSVQDPIAHGEFDVAVGILLQQQPLPDQPFARGRDGPDVAGAGGIALANRGSRIGGVGPFVPVCRKRNVAAERACLGLAADPSGL